MYDNEMVDNILMRGESVNKRLFSNFNPGERTNKMGDPTTDIPSDGNYLKVSRADEAVLIKVYGLGNMFLAPTMQSFVDSESSNGFLNFVVDLEHCTGMDSTFMGTFIGLTMMIKRKFGWFCLVNVSDENRRLLKLLGVISMVSINDGPMPAFDGEFAILKPTTDPYVRQKQIHGAHRFLMDADPANKERFGAFIQALEEELSDIPKIVPPTKKNKENTDNSSTSSV